MKSNRLLYEFVSEKSGEHHNFRHTLKQNPLKFDDLAEFIKCYNPDNRGKRKEACSEKNPEGRWRKYSYEEVVARDKCNLDIFWLKDDSLVDLDNLPEPEEIAAEIVAGLEAASEKFRSVLTELNR